MDSRSRIVGVEELPAGSTFLFTVREGFDEKEVLLVRLDGDVAAWRNYCPHWTDSASTRAAAPSSATATPSVHATVRPSSPGRAPVRTVPARGRTSRRST